MQRSFNSGRLAILRRLASTTSTKASKSRLGGGGVNFKGMKPPQQQQQDQQEQQTPPRRSYGKALSLYLGTGALIAGGLWWSLSSNKGKGYFDAVTGALKSFDKPAFKKMLPEMSAENLKHRPYTLVLDFDKFLVCHIFDKDKGRWRVAKRPGVDEFLFYAAQFFEVIIFSSLSQNEGEPLVRGLDPYGCISFSLFRGATTTGPDGVLLKDLDCINRPLEKVIVLGHDQKGFSLQPDNFIKVPEWSPSIDKDGKDLSLEKCLDYLEVLAMSKLPDLRPQIRRFHSKELPSAFDAIQESQMNSPPSSSLFKGFKPSASSDISSNNDQFLKKKMERISLRRKEYARIRKLMDDQLKEQQRKEKEHYAKHKMSLTDLFIKGGPEPPKPDDN